MTARLDPDRRQTALDQLGREPLDALVVGGGIVGAGVALDVALQLAAFHRAYKQARAAGLEPTLRHLANSAAALLI